MGCAHTPDAEPRRSAVRTCEKNTENTGSTACATLQLTDVAKCGTGCRACVALVFRFFSKDAGKRCSASGICLVQHVAALMNHVLSMRFVLALFAIFISSCRSREPSTLIGVVPKGSTHVFWQTVHAGAVKAAGETGYKILWNAPAQEADRGRQIAIVESMINQRVAGIALAPSDREALSAVVERAALNGIPVMIFDSGIDTPKRIGYVGTNNREGGAVAGRRMGAALKGKGLVAIITDSPGSASTSERDQGFIQELRRNFAGVRLLETQYCDSSRAKARSITENLLTAHGDLTGVFADHENATAGAALALKARGRKDVKLVGFDASELLTADMKDGWIDSLIVQNPFRMGYEAVRAIAAKLRGGSPAAETDTGVTLVGASDLERQDIRELLFPKSEQYLRSRKRRILGTRKDNPSEPAVWARVGPHVQRRRRSLCGVPLRDARRSGGSAACARGYRRG